MTEFVQVIKKALNLFGFRVDPHIKKGKIDLLPGVKRGRYSGLRIVHIAEAAGISSYGVKSNIEYLLENLPLDDIVEIFVGKKGKKHNSRKGKASGHCGGAK